MYEEEKLFVKLWWVTQKYNTKTYWLKIEF